MTECILVPTGSTRDGITGRESEYHCAVCGRPTWSKYPPELTHVMCKGERPSVEAMERAKVEGGAGTELTTLLATWGIEYVPGCQCAIKATEMDARGIAWCEANFDTIVGWLLTEYRERGMPVWKFAPPGLRLIARALPQDALAEQAARMALRLAIRRAKKKAKGGASS